ncbi:MAG TPA: hypothetical protein VJZ76_03120 [Thermoanaerobaculia bacterium]|nr:hypothetical protein [Thermoanaerobaculia bacterium]
MPGLNRLDREVADLERVPDRRDVERALLPVIASVDALAGREEVEVGGPVQRDVVARAVDGAGVRIPELGGVRGRP